MSSTVAAVKATLQSVLAAAVPDAQVIYGPRSGVTITTDLVMAIGRVTGTSVLDSMSVATREERYVVEVDVSASLRAVDQRDADDKALTAYAAAESAIRTFPGSALGLEAAGVMSALPTGEFQLAELADEDGRHAAVRFGVAVYAQTT